ncbi:Sec-independent protein translocase subunit TatA/TatB [Tepidibacter aestuarii]|uniref:Sec-independent protein translocase subunit TatA/TatB n=1 Tax=Tepidibacter aestuarii TaxID=2925782 RepID=UPI0020BE514D|nr:twin-arginine translocase TatA/TatE family subunit [Tepidibacter aestuarii]CAH2213392.1 Sec-independent protein translocase protein TatA [Tepidibacter aestuarii]
MVFNIGVTEILIISVAGYLILGPKRLPEIGKKAGEAVRKISKETEGINNEIKEIKEAVTK